ncbi:SWIM zinc finger family protein [Flavobacterium filum]|uniref:SWIM zinc finger family protein n=1 Tax=Flavobacterium filum TaxID=370974 RepID=UPI0023F0BEF5|nr:SWIM zinc finger family protein [Flavobacterium filum]
MTTFKFLVQGSVQYQTTFEIEGNNIRAFCTCPAGDQGAPCKHRYAILSGDSSAIVGDKSQVANLLQAFKGSPLDLKIQELTESEKQLAFFTKKVPALKKEVGKLMLGQ